MSSIDNNIDSLSHDERRKLLEKILLNESEGFNTFPLSFSQQRLWFLEQFMPGSPVYNYPLVLRLCGLLNVKVLEKSLNEILRRHDILRISISSEKGKAVQNVNPYKKLTIPIIDLSDLMEDERENLAIEKAKQEVQKPFMLSKGPLIRFTLIKLNPLEHILVVNTHHIISDGWSMGVLIKELTVLYEAINKGLNSPLPKLPIQYTDFAVWQREWLEGEVLEKQGAYWKGKLGGDLPILELPTDRPPSNSPSLRGSLYEFKIPKDLNEKLKSLCKEEGSTLYMLLLATYNVLLHRYSGQDDILVGTPIANRDREEVENLIGFFVNTLVLRTNFSENLTFRQLLRQVLEAALESYTHQDYPFDRLVEELKPDRGMSQSPLFRVMFQYQNAPIKPATMSDLTVESISIYREAAKFDLTLTFMDEEETDSLIGYLEYNMDLFDLKTIERMIEHFCILLLGIVNSPDQLIAKLPVLSEHENDTLLNWNNTLTPYPKEKCFHELFEEQVEKTPDAIAVSFEEEKLTYRELNNRANQLAHYLKKQGIGPEVLVGICLERSCEMIIGILGIHKVGGAYVPIDSTYPKDRIAYMLKDSQVSLLLTQQKLIPLFSQLNENLICLDRQWEEILQESKNDFVSKVTSNNLAYVIYTSGSTGRPKGVMIQHYSLTNYLVWCIKEYDVTHGEGTIVHSSLSFDLTITSIFPSLLVGKEVTLIPESADIEAFGEIIKGSKSLSLLKITPAHLKLLSQQLKPEEFAGKAHTIVIGGEPLFEENTALWRKYAPNTRLINEYGPTETVVGCSTYEVSSDTFINGQVPIGRPISNVQIYILDKNLQQVPVGVKGEIYIGGEGVARGYLNQPELTTEKFIIDSFSGRQGARLYKTGDLGRYLRDGNIEFLGRMDDQVKVRGYRIELGEIETLLSQHPVVDSTAVLIQEDKTKDKRLVAYITFKEDQVLSSNELRQYLRGYLPEYMIPSVFEKLDTMPLTINGKIDRGLLKKTNINKLELNDSYAAPRDQVELKMVNLWEEILQRKNIGIFDNFFELGGHSLKALELLATFNEHFDIDLPLAILFKKPTVIELCDFLRGKTVIAHSSCMVPIQEGQEGSRPLFLIHPGGGGIFGYFHLVKSLGEKEKVYGLQSVGYESDETPLQSIETMATHYIKEIKKVVPHGPYRLAGWSFGGNVAYEMTRQLEMIGEKVEFLGLIDTIPTTISTSNKPPHIRVLSQVASSIGLEDVVSQNYDEEKLLSLILNRAQELNQLPRGENPITFQRKMQVAVSNAYAKDNYTYIGKIHSDIFLYKVSETSSVDPLPLVKSQDWSNRTLGKLHVFEITGNHHNLNTPPHVITLAESIKKALNYLTV